MTQAEAFFLKQSDGWHMVIRFTDGHEMISDEAYDTMDECATAFDQWCQDTGTAIEKAKPQ